MLDKTTQLKLERFKGKIINSTLLVGVIIGSLAYITSHVPFHLDDKKSDFYTNLSILIILATVYIFRNKISTQNKALTIIFVIFGLVISDTIVCGLSATNNIVIILIPFYALIILNYNRAIMLFGLAISMYLGIGCLHIFEILPTSSDLPKNVNQVMTWVSDSLMLSCIAIITIIFAKKYNEVVLELIVDVDNKTQDLKFREEKLALEKAFSSNLIDNIPGIFNLFKKNGNEFTLVKWNKNSEKAYGFSASDFLGQSPLAGIHRDYQSRVTETVENTKVGETGRLEVKIWHKTKKENSPLYYFEIRHIKYNGEDYFMATGIDISDKKEAERLHEEEKRFSDRLLDIFPGMFYLYEKIDGVFSLSRWNKKMEIETGYTHEELSGMRPRNFFSEENHELLRESLAHINEKEYMSMELPIQKKDGKGDHWYFLNQIIKDNNKEYLLGFGMDIAQRKKMERELELRNTNLNDMLKDLEHRNKKLAEYAFINSHLLRAPLARILGLAELVSKEVILSEHQELLGSFTTSAQELDAIVSKINDVLDQRKELNRDEILDILENPKINHQTK